MHYTAGFHPKPDMIFGPALSLGVPSFGEYIDIKLLVDQDPIALMNLMNSSVPEGLRFTGASRLGPMDPAITKVVGAARYALIFARSALPGDEAWLREQIARSMAAEKLEIRREIERTVKTVDVRAYLQSARVGTEEARDAARRAALVGDLVVIEAMVKVTNDGAVKASEVAEVLVGAAIPSRAVRMELLTESGESPLAIIGRPPQRKPAASPAASPPAGSLPAGATPAAAEQPQPGA